MREFLTESALPFFGVCGAILGLTLVLFDVPWDPPAQAAVALAASVSPSAETPARAREQMNDVLARAMRNLDAARAPRPTSGVNGRAPSAALAASAPRDPSPNGIPTAATTPTDPGFLQTVSALGEAVKAVHAVRTEEDLVRAEDSMRQAREQMEETCKAGGGGGPLCDGAAQMRSLGY